MLLASEISKRLGSKSTQRAASIASKCGSIGRSPKGLTLSAGNWTLLEEARAIKPCLQNTCRRGVDRTCDGQVSIKLSPTCPGPRRLKPCQ